MKKVVVIGGGFGGIRVVKSLMDRPGFEITLIDQNNYHCFQPLLYQVASCGLNPGDISVSLRSIFRRHENVSIKMGVVTHIDMQKCKVALQDGLSSYSYDYLVCSMGSETSYFGHPQWSEHAYELKGLSDAVSIRNKVLTLLETKERLAADPIRIAIIGGGPSGVELAGSLAEFFQYSTQHEFTQYEPRQSEIYLYEQSPNLLSSFGQALSDKTKYYLNKLNVKVRCSSTITNIQKDEITVQDVKKTFDMIIWTAGVQAKSIVSNPLFQTGKANRTVVQSDLSISGFDHVFVIGDQSVMQDKAYPTLAPVAIAQGQSVAQNIVRHAAGKKTHGFIYKDKGSLAVIGRSKAVAIIKGYEFSGFLAWLIWCFAHIIPLVSFRNKILVFFEFVWSFIHYHRGVRIITDQADSTNNQSRQAN